MSQVAAAQLGGTVAAVAREKEVLYRLISGMHTSITTSIVQNYYDEKTGEWRHVYGIAVQSCVRLPMHIIVACMCTA